MNNNNKKSLITSPIGIVILFGIISMLGDILYESARSANSQYLKLLGTSAATVGFVFGIGELLGYGLRLLAGILSDKSNKHWLFMFIGYGMLIVVPLMGFTLNWNIIIILILMERIGKALRSPAKDTILSVVSDKQVGIGFAFGLQEALDQIGAFAGPLIFTAVFYFSAKNGLEQYQTGYKILLIPLVILILFLIYVYQTYQKNNLGNIPNKNDSKDNKLTSVFWIYTIFTFFCSLGFTNFSLIGYHLKSQNILSDGEITLAYSFAMVIDAIIAVIVGNFYDYIKNKTQNKTNGVLMLMIIPVFTIAIPFFTLGNSRVLIILGMIAFGIVIGTHETIMRSTIADITPYNKRGTSYGIFNTAYGLALFFGAFLTGILYDTKNIGLIVAFVCISQTIAVGAYWYMVKIIKK